jgi:hypothetical protein
VANPEKDGNRPHPPPGLRHLGLAAPARKIHDSPNALLTKSPRTR